MINYSDYADTNGVIEACFRSYCDNSKIHETELNTVNQISKIILDKRNSDILGMQECKELAYNVYQMFQVHYWFFRCITALTEV